MSEDVREGQAVSFRYDPPVRWATPTGLVLDPSGKTLEEPAPSVNPFSSTVASATERDVFDVVSGAGLSPADLVEVADPSWGTALATVRFVDGDTVGLVEPLPGVPDVTATVLGADITLAAAAINNRGKGFRAIVRFGPDELATVFHVVHSVFANPITARRVREYAEHFWPNDPFLTDEVDAQRVADAAGRRVRTRLLASRVYPHTIWDASDLIEAGEIAMMIELAERNLVPGDTDITTYRRGLVLDLRDAVGDILSGSTPRDDNEDNQLSDLESRGLTFGGLTR